MDDHGVERSVGPAHEYAKRRSRLGWRWTSQRGLCLARLRRSSRVVHLLGSDADERLGQRGATSRAIRRPEVLSSTIGFGSTLINGLPASTYFNNAQEQAIWRRDRTDNFEMNVQSGTYTTGSLQVAGLMGFRYFRFSDSLTYGSASFGNSFTSNGGGDAAYLNFQCHNSLYGGQVRAMLSSIMTRRLTVFAVPKVGVYGNTMVDLQQIYGGSTVNSPVSYFHTNKTDVSVLASWIRASPGPATRTSRSFADTA